MYYHARKVDSLYCGIVISETLLLLFWRKFALRLLLNRSCNLLVIRMSAPSLLLILRMVLVWMLLWKTFGVVNQRNVLGFQSLAASNKCSSLSAAYKKHENIKCRAYGHRIREVEHASFIPIVLSATGELAHEATIFYKHLAFLLST